MTDQTLLSTKDVALLTGFSSRTISRMVSTERICSPIKVGARAIRWRKADINNWIDQGCPDRATFEAKLNGGAA